MFGRKKEKKPKKPYNPRSNELGKFGTILLMLMGAVMLVFFLVNITTFVFGEKTYAQPFTKLVDGQAVAQESVDMSSTMYYTFTDKDGVVRQGSGNLLGTTIDVTSAVTVFYLPAFPDHSILSASDGIDISTIGCFVLGIILIGSGEESLKKLRQNKAAAEAEKSENPETEILPQKDDTDNVQKK